VPPDELELSELGAWWGWLLLDPRPVLWLYSYWPSALKKATTYQRKILRTACHNTQDSTRQHKRAGDWCIVLLLKLAKVQDGGTALAALWPNRIPRYG
jgi:hypothetical protein